MARNTADGDAVQVGMGMGLSGACRACRKLGQHWHKNNKTLTKIIARTEYKKGANKNQLRSRGQPGNYLKRRYRCQLSLLQLYLVETIVPPLLQLLK